MNEIFKELAIKRTKAQEIVDTIDLTIKALFKGFCTKIVKDIPDFVGVVSESTDTSDLVEGIYSIGLEKYDFSIDVLTPEFVLFVINDETMGINLKFTVPTTALVNMVDDTNSEFSRVKSEIETEVATLKKNLEE